MRTKRIMTSTLAEVIPYIILGIIGFVKVRVLIDNLGSDLNGYYQFINQFISYLFLIEAGFGRAVIYKLYKPFADHDHDQISATFNGARKIFRNIGLAIFALIVVSTLIIPFVFDIKAAFVTPVMLTFFIISIAYLIAYFGKNNAYYALFSADQKKYVYSLVFNILKIIDDILIIVVAIYFNSLIVIAFIILIIKILEEMLIRYYGRKHFPFLNKKAKPDTSSFNMTKDLVWHQVSFLISNNADVIILLYFINPLIVSIYTTYNFIARFLNELTTRINNVVSYAFGNMFAKGEEERSYQVNDEYFIFSVMLALVVALTFTLGIRPFVGIWINNPGYYLSYEVVILFGFNLFLWTIYSPLIAVINAKGLYKESRNAVVLSAIINVVLTVWLIATNQNSSLNNLIALTLTATVIANIVNIMLRINVVQKYAFPKLNRVNLYIEYFVYSIIFLLLTVNFVCIEAWLFKLNNSFISVISGILLVGLLNLVISLIILLITKHNTKLVIKRLLSNILRRKHG